jgi:diaminopimelate decarboxylase
MTTPYPLLDTLHQQGIAPLSLSATDDGNLSVGGVTVRTLLETYGSPLYVMDGSTLRANAQAYTQACQQAFGQDKALVLYACKANLSMGLAKLLAEEGMGFDAVSRGELLTLLRAGVSPDKIAFNGNNKTEADLVFALDHGIRRIVVDNFDELDLLCHVCEHLHTQANILVRVTPGIECHTHDYIRTGQHDSKFGIPLASVPALAQRLAQADAQAHITLKGLHAHIGSQIFELSAYDDLVTILLQTYAQLRDEHGLTLTELDVGGGLGMAYTQADDPPTPQQLMDMLTKALHRETQRHKLPMPFIYMEPGRSIVAKAGMTLYTVGSRKLPPQGALPYVAVDGGMGDNIRPALYQAAYTAVVASRLADYADPATHETVRIVGHYCESGDVLLPNFTGPQLRRGDTLLVFGTGAYNYAMSSRYNRFPTPAMVLVEEGRHGWLVARPTHDDLLAHDRCPAWLH